MAVQGNERLAAAMAPYLQKGEEEEAKLLRAFCLTNYLHTE